ncbi:MAG: CDP-glucose 4,6-dehydratase [Woeseiaceae bacterium]|nr:CDP-glucose 4,6-dehydratase [Woeseiaceae bacterium]
MNPEFWRGKRVLLTGHTGFKGSWLSLWLQDLGADVYGYSIDVPTSPSLYETAAVRDGMTSTTGDVRDLDSLTAFMKSARPEVVIHLAAQSLVRRSYADPAETYGTNVLGTVNVLEAVRKVGQVRVVIIVTSDKCYANQEREQGYREDEPMGGYDPYSSSKGCAELVTSAYTNSFFNPASFDEHGTAVASVRAGNVIGGGDWAEDRLIPDVVAALRTGAVPAVRNPDAVRPWQFVLDPLNGYLMLAESLWNDGPNFAGAWNFGPDDGDTQKVGSVVAELSQQWGGNGGWDRNRGDHPHEANFLKLDSSKARTALSWSPKLPLGTALAWIADWYKVFDDKREARDVTLAQIHRFQQLAAG